jgi:hypothetical protein
MGKKENRIYLHAIICRYRRANRTAKGVILDEFCSVCGPGRVKTQIRFRKWFEYFLKCIFNFIQCAFK